MKVHTYIKIICLVYMVYGRDLTQEPGHMKDFGFAKLHLIVDEINEFPEPEIFFKEFAFRKRPLVMRNAAKLSPAFHLWSDDYFLTVNEPDGSFVSVETMKKEDRTQEVREMAFTQFVSSYNNSGIYMVNPVPKFISQDVVLPCCLQCSSLSDGKLVESIMWFSSGGTKSVVHTDAVDNINCLYRGDKQFIMVDPDVYGDKVDMDHPEGSYSGVDVDNVDFTKYPGLADVEYYNVSLTAGDCLYIPYKWIHQVRSFGSNIAVNIWWNHFLDKNSTLESCNKECDLGMTLNSLSFRGFDQITENIDAIKDHFFSIVSRSKEYTYKQFENDILAGDTELFENRKIDYRSIMQKMFDEMDVNGDGFINSEEMVKMDENRWENIQKEMEHLTNLINDLGKLETGEFRFKDEL